MTTSRAVRHMGTLVRVSFVREARERVWINYPRTVGSLKARSGVMLIKRSRNLVLEMRIEVPSVTI